MALTTKIDAKIVATLTDALDLSTVSDPLTIEKALRWSSGTGANQADQLWHDRRTLAASATENLDLAGVLVNAFGDTVTFARIKAVLVTAASANTNNVNVIRETTNGVPLFLALGDGIAVRPNGLFLWVAPDATAVVVTAATGDLLTVTNSGAGSSVTYDIVIAGATA